MVRSVKDRLKNDFNVAVAEVETWIMHQMGGLGVATVANETSSHVQEIFGQVLVLSDFIPSRNCWIMTWRLYREERLKSFL